MLIALVAVVAEKTGYPAEVLDLDMQLDADLGIDSIKRVEIFSALQERHPELPAMSPDQLGAFRTLRAITEFLDQTQAVLPAPTLAEPAPQALRPEATSGESDLSQILLEAVAEKTGYPVEMLELDMRLDADLGIDSIKRVEIFSALQDRIPAMTPAGPERIGTLGTLNDIVDFLAESSRGGRVRSEPIRGSRTRKSRRIGCRLGRSHKLP